MTELHFKCRHNSGLSIGWLLSGSTKIFQNNPFWINNNCCWNVCSIQADVSTLESTVSIYNLPAEVQFHTLKKQPQPNRLSWINASVINYDPFLEGNLINISQSSFQHWNSEPIQKKLQRNYRKPEKCSIARAKQQAEHSKQAEHTAAHYSFWFSVHIHVTHEEERIFPSKSHKNIWTNYNFFWS